VPIQISPLDTADSPTVEWRVDDGIWQTTAFNSTSGYYEASWGTTTVIDGNHPLEARITYSDGTMATDSILVTAENVDDPPVVSWVTPNHNETVRNTLTIQTAASDDRSSTKTLSVKWRIDGGLWQTAVYNSGTGFHEAPWDTTGVADGNYPLEALATDEVGNTSSLATITVIVNNATIAMYVWEMTWSEKQRGRGGTVTDLSVTVDVKQDANRDGIAAPGDDSVDGATVTLVLTHDSDGDGNFEPGLDDTSWTFQGITTGGRVTFTLKSAPGGNYRAEMTDLTHALFTWNSTLDADNLDQYCGLPLGLEC